MLQRFNCCSTFNWESEIDRYTWELGSGILSKTIQSFVKFADEGENGTRLQVLFFIKASNSSCIACFQPASYRASLTGFGSFGCRKEVMELLLECANFRCGCCSSEWILLLRIIFLLM